jgi:hypothetical protein
VRWLRLVALLAALLPFSHLARSATIYSNNKYGFRVTIPTGLAVDRDAPPAPEHGLGIRLGGDREVWVSAYYDVTFQGSAAAALQDSLRSARRVALTPLRHTSPAARAETDGNHRHGVHVVAIRRRRQDVAILYFLSLDSDAAHATGDAAAFQAILRGFAARPLPH